MYRVRNSFQRFQTFVRNKINARETTSGNDGIEQQTQNATVRVSAQDRGTGARTQIRTQQKKKPKAKSAKKRRRFLRNNKVR